MPHNKIILGLSLLVLIGLVGFPWLRMDYLSHIVLMIFLYAYLGLSWNLIGGFGGQLSLGHAAFFGIGAYTSTLLYIHIGLSPWIGMLIGAFLSMCVGLFIGFLSFRYGLKGHFFALTTIAFAEIIRLIALNIKFLGSAKGLLVPFKGNAPWLYQFNGKIAPYYIIMAMMLIGLAVNFAVSRSRLGFYLLAIRDDEASASALGVNIFKYKMVAMGMSSFMTALGGTFVAQYTMYIQPDFTLALSQSIDILIRPIIGGVGTVLGPVLGSFLLGPLSELSRIWLSGYHGVHLIVYGSILMIFVIFLPDGLIGIWERYKIRRIARMEEVS